jgi:hypothetical protein
MTSNITKDDITKITKDDIIEGFLEKLPGKPTKYKVRVKRQLEPIVVWESDLRRVLTKDVFNQMERERKARGAAAARRAGEARVEDEASWGNLPHAKLENPDPNIFSRQEGGRKSRKKKRTRKRKRKTKRKRKKKRRKSRIKTRRKRKKRKTKKIWKSL